MQPLKDHAPIEQQVFFEPPIVTEEQLAIEEQAAIEQQTAVEEQSSSDLIAEQEKAPKAKSKFILGMETPANTATRLTWTPENNAGGLAERTPVLVVNGKSPRKTLCLTAAMYGDERN